LKRWAILTGLFVLALFVRVPALGGFVTFDEPRWINRSRWFMGGLLFADQECPPVEWGREFATQGLGCTLQIGYPGTTTMWAGSLGLLIHYWQTASPDVDLRAFLQSLPVYTDPSMIAPTRLPLAIAGALFVPFFYGLLAWLFTRRVALVAALLVALHPFHIALSRVLHHDALNTTFMVLSLLTLTGYWLRGWRWYWLPVSAVMAGLAFLSKQVSWFMPPYVFVLAGWTLYYRWQWQKMTENPSGSVPSIWPMLGRLIGDGILWGLIAGSTFVAFFPAMWIIPLKVLRTIFGASTALADEGHTHYFLGEVSKNPGPLFYPLGWLLRGTPFEVLGLLGVILAAMGSLARRRSLKEWAIEHPVKVALVLFVGLLWLFLSVPDKKLVRYFLPAFPIIDLFVALGLFWLLDRLKLFSNKGISHRGVILLAGVILLGQGWLVWNHFPYYLTYHNPLLVGPVGAARLMTIIGWGEGLNEAADYLNQQPEAESLQVVAERFCTMFRPFFKGKVSCLNSSVGGIMHADYLVYYYNLIQRDLQWPEQWQYFQQHHSPVHRVTLHGLDYVLIYRNPIQHHVDREANSLPRAFTAFGYNLSADGQLTLFWQNSGLGQRQLLVGLAVTQGVYPVNGAVVSDVERQWLLCTPTPAFTVPANTPKAIVESVCPLNTANLSAGLYDLQLAVRDGPTLTPVKSSRLAVLLVDQNGRFEHINLVEAFQ
jgi:hypothetical protein